MVLLTDPVIALDSVSPTLDPISRRVTTPADLERRYGLRGTAVLDAGCGPGWFVEALRDAGATQIVESHQELIDQLAAAL